ncbi:hypothetical protein [Sphingobacterium endophyticum]|uniref:hypothetical protein n=1 Tax=Sphingobacterium endophyticum TaxID=2546448 RepID=UPI0012E2CEC4|nr:hypothetical protein [Sphingobacterium endophyticum]
MFADSKSKNPKLDIDEFTERIIEGLAAENIDWQEVANLFGDAISQSIGSE